MQEKALTIIDFKPQTLPSDCILKENKILRISDFAIYKYALFVKKSLRRENVVIFSDMFTPLNLNHNHNTCAARAAINHLLIYLRSNHVTMGLTPSYLQLQKYGTIS